MLLRTEAALKIMDHLIHSKKKKGVNNMGKGCVVCTLIHNLISKCSDIKYFEVHWEACVTVEN